MPTRNETLTRNAYKRYRNRCAAIVGVYEYPTWPNLGDKARFDIALITATARRNRKSQALAIFRYFLHHDLQGNKYQTPNNRPS